MIRTWISAMQCNPDFQTDTFYSLNLKVNPELDKYKIANLVIDGMSIKALYEYVPHLGRNLGYVDVGYLIESDASDSYLCFGLIAVSPLSSAYCIKTTFPPPSSSIFTVLLLAISSSELDATI